LLQEAGSLNHTFQADFSGEGFTTFYNVGGIMKRGSIYRLGKGVEEK